MFVVCYNKELLYTYTALGSAVQHVWRTSDDMDGAVDAVGAKYSSRAPAHTRRTCRLRASQTRQARQATSQATKQCSRLLPSPVAHPHSLSACCAARCTVCANRSRQYLSSSISGSAIPACLQPAMPCNACTVALQCLWSWHCLTLCPTVTDADTRKKRRECVSADTGRVDVGWLCAEMDCLWMDCLCVSRSGSGSWSVGAYCMFEHCMSEHCMSEHTVCTALHATIGRNS